MKYSLKQATEIVRTKALELDDRELAAAYNALQEHLEKLEVLHQDLQELRRLGEELRNVVRPQEPLDPDAQRAFDQAYLKKKNIQVIEVEPAKRTPEEQARLDELYAAIHKKRETLHRHGI